ncbi:hypothetical protein C8Q80DRAFT_1186463 [Daedaleopsis nitida]|nr:hypothetical protein C8Q80DRAFT_1186463 [Daedaleopsis nitida]
MLFPNGVATSVLSLVTNITATGLIAYKAWHHRRMVKQHLSTGSARTRAERTLTLLVESGIVYCILWVFVVAYQVTVDTFWFWVSYPSYILETKYSYNFTKGFQYIVEGCLVPLIGLYPTLIILLVSLDKSHCENNFSYRSRDIPPLRIPHSHGIFPQVRVIPERVISIARDSMASPTSSSRDLTAQNYDGMQYKAGDLENATDLDAAVEMSVLPGSQNRISDMMV